jgi:hypothetical protein
MRRACLSATSLERRSTRATPRNWGNSSKRIGPLWQIPDNPPRMATAQERPQTRTILKRSFYLGQTEVTQEAWSKMVRSLHLKTAGRMPVSSVALNPSSDTVAQKKPNAWGTCMTCSEMPGNLPLLRSESIVDPKFEELPLAPMLRWQSLRTVRSGPTVGSPTSFGLRYTQRDGRAMDERYPGVGCRCIIQPTSE